MLEYRVTKYDPSLRDARGAYTAHEWSSVHDIGREFGGVALTDDECRRVEEAYIESALAFLTEGGLISLRVEGLENRRGSQLQFSDGSVVSVKEIGDLIRPILREEFWCRFEAPTGFLHLGWDYYMFIGVPYRCQSAEKLAIELGLFVEEFASPYTEDR